MITQIRLEHDVNIQFPDKDDGNQVRKTTEADTPLAHSGDLCPDLGTVARQTCAQMVVREQGSERLQESGFGSGFGPHVGPCRPSEVTLTWLCHRVDLGPFSCANLVMSAARCALVAPSR